MKKLYIALGIIVLLGAGTFAGIKYSHPTEPLKTFTDSTGAYSFEYPAYISVAENNGGAYLFTGPDPSQKPLAIVAPFYYPNFLANAKSAPSTDLTEVGIGKYQVYKIIQTPDYYRYLIPLEDTDNPSNFILINKSSAGDLDLSVKQIEAIISSFKFDKEKILVLTQKQLESARAKGLEARLRSDLSQTRVVAELYFTTAKGYSSFCNLSTRTKDTQAIFDDIVKNAGADNVACFAQKDSYAVSVKFASGEIMCVDSTGVSTSTLAMITGPYCKK